VYFFVALGAQGDQVRVVIISLLAAPLLVMDLKFLSGTANLAFPAIALQYLSSQLVVRLPIKPEARLLGKNPVHEAFGVTSSRKACR